MEVLENNPYLRPFKRIIFGLFTSSTLRLLRLVSRASKELVKQELTLSLNGVGVTAGLSEVHLLFAYRFLFERAELRFPANLKLALHLTQLSLPFHHQVWKVFWNSLTDEELHLNPAGLNLPTTYLPHQFPKWFLQSLIVGGETSDDESEVLLEELDARFSRLEGVASVFGPIYLNSIPKTKLRAYQILTHRAELGTSEPFEGLTDFWLLTRAKKYHLTQDITCLDPDDGKLDFARNGLQELTIEEGLKLPITLSLEVNEFSHFPAAAIAAGKFEEVSLAYNPLLQCLSTSIQLTQLVTLTLCECGIREFPPSFAAAVPNLVVLDLSRNPLESFDPAFFTYRQIQTSGTRFLYLFRCKLTSLRLHLPASSLCSTFHLGLSNNPLTELFFIIKGQEHLVTLDKDGQWTDQRYLEASQLTVRLSLNDSYPGMKPRENNPTSIYSIPRQSVENVYLAFDAKFLPQ